MFVVQVQQVRVQSVRRQSRSTVAACRILDKVVACPLCATTDALVDDVAQFIDSFGRPCDHAETVATVEVLHIQFITGAGGHFRSQQRGRHGGGDEGILLQFRSIFGPPSIWTLRPRVTGTRV